MIRILNFVSFALAALCCLALYHLSEETRVARVRLLSVEKQIVEDHDAMVGVSARTGGLSCGSRAFSGPFCGTLTATCGDAPVLMTSVVAAFAFAFA